jgi:hypothetical protein
MATSMASTRFSASRFLPIAAVQSITASIQGGGIVMRDGRGVDNLGKIILYGVVITTSATMTGRNVERPLSG